MNFRKPFLGVLLIFTMGLMIGGMGIYWIERIRFQNALKSPERLAFFFMHQVSQKLDLDQVQQDHLAVVVQKSRTQLTEIRREAVPKIEEIFRESEQEILKFLRPDQQRKFQRLVERRKKFFERKI